MPTSPERSDFSAFDEDGFNDESSRLLDATIDLAALLKSVIPQCLEVQRAAQTAYDAEKKLRAILGPAKAPGDKDGETTIAPALSDAWARDLFHSANIFRRQLFGALGMAVRKLEMQMDVFDNLRGKQGFD